MDRFGPPFEVNHFSRLDRFDRNRPFHVFSMFYMEEKAYHCSFYGLLTADLSVLLIHPCAVTTTLSQLQQHHRNKILTLVRCSKKSYYHSYFSDHMSNVRKTWIGINHLIGQNKRRCKPIVALPNVLNELFPSVGQTLAASVPPATHHFSDYLPAVNSPSSFFFKPVTSMELENEILLLPINKSHGLYCCPVRALKSSSSVLSRPLAHIMNNSGLTGQYTSKLKHARVIPILSVAMKRI